MEKKYLQKVIIQVIFLLVNIMGFAGPNWNYTPQNPPSWAFVIVNPGTVTINGSPISVGDYIGLFYDLTGGGLACGGYSQWLGSQVWIIAYGSTGTNNGFAINEAYKYKVWRASDGNEGPAIATYSDGGTYQGNYSTSTIATLTATITIPYIATATGTNPNCFGLCNGSVSLTVSGATTPYFYLWSNGSYAKNLSNLCAGTYTVTVYDGSGYIAMPFNWTYSITSGSHNVLVSTNGTYSVSGNPLSNGDYLGVFYNITGGGLGCGGYMLYQGIQDAVTIWGDDATTTEKDGFTDNEIFQWKVWRVSNQHIINLTATYNTSAFPCTGTYISGGLSGLTGLTGTDPVTAAEITTATAILTPSSQLNIGFTVSNYDGYGVSHFGACDGSIILNVTGGTTPYTYLWPDGSTVSALDNLCAATYSVTVASGQCTETASITLTQQFLSASGTVTNLSCYNICNGSIDLSPAGGLTPYVFSWSNGATAQDLNNLCAGNYSVTVTDSYGNTGPLLWNYIYTSSNHTILISSSGTYTGNGYPLSTGDYLGVFYTLTGGGLGCGGYALYTTGLTNSVAAWGDDNMTTVKDGFLNGETFQWQVWHMLGTNNGVVFSATATYMTSLPNQGTFTTNGLSGIVGLAGNYTTVQANTATASFTVDQPASTLSVTGTVNNIHCNGDDSGSVDITVTGGIPPYSQIWSNGAITEDISSIPAGSYSVTVTDSNQCVANASFTVTQPAMISISATITNSPCASAGNGAIYITVSGGATPYSYSWSNGATTQSISGLAPGSYDLQLSDYYNCLSTGAWNITEPSTLQLSATVTNAFCYGCNTGAIDLTASGGTTPYQFIWSNNETTEDLNNIPAGFYTVTVTDTFQCMANATFSVIDQVQLIINYTTIPPGCYGYCDGEINVIVQSGIPPIEFNWSDGNSTQSLSNLCSGDYYLTVTDGIGSSLSYAITLNQPGQLITESVIIFPEVCENLPGIIQLIIQGGISPYQYLWSQGSTNEIIEIQVNSNYSVTVTDQNGCASSAQFAIPAPLNQLSTNWNYNVTGSNHSILIPSYIPVLINGTQIQNGDIIGVFYDSLGTLNCGGKIIWNGNTTGLVAWGEDIGDDGFETGEPFKWVIWDVSENIKYHATATYFISGFANLGNYQPNGISGLASLTAFSAEVTEWLMPQSACNLTDSEQVIINIYNPNYSPVSGITVTYSVDNGNSFISENVTSLINSHCNLQYTFTESADLSAPGIYYCVAGTYGSSTEDTIISDPVPYVNAGPDTIICAGSYLILGGTASYFSSVSWNTNGDGFFSDYSSLAPVYIPGTGDIINGTVILTITVFGSGQCSNIVITDDMTLTIDPFPLANAGSDASICAGSIYSLSGTVENAGSVSWSTSGDGIFDDNNLLNAGYLPGINDIASGTVTLTLTAFGSGQCTDVEINDYLLLTVVPQPSVALSDNQVVCNNSSTIPVNFAGSIGGTVFNWTNDNINIGLIASGTGDISSFIATNNGTTPVMATITVIPSYTNNGLTCTGIPHSFTITVNPTPTINQPADQVVCDNSVTTTLTFAGSVSGTIFDWNNNNISIGLAASGTGDISSFTATNTGVVPVTATITVTPSYSNGGITCTGTPQVFTITVNPTPAVSDPADQVVCNNSPTATVAFTGSVTGTVYNWTNDDISIGLAASGTGDISSFTATNNGVVPVTATITVTPSYSNGGITCTGTAQSFTITINPTPTADAGGNTVICTNSILNLSGSATNAGSVIWSTSGDGTFDDSSSLTANYVPGTNDISDGIVILTLTVNGIGICNSIMMTDDMTLTFDPMPVVSAGTDAAICSGSTFTLSGTVSNYGALSWSTSGDGVFDNNTSLTTIYTPGTSDISGGIAILVLTVQGTGECQNVQVADTTSLTIYPLPVVSINGLPNSTCLNAPPFQLTGVPAGGAFSGQGILSDTFYPLNAGLGSTEITYQYTDENNCTNVIIMNIVVYPSPVADIGPGMMIMADETVTLQAGNNFVNYLWNTGATTSSILVNITGNYQVTVTDQNNCQAVSNIAGIIVAPWSYDFTGSNHTIMVPDTTIFDINSLMPETGDFLGVFYENEGNLQCGGFVYWNGVSTALSAWGDDATTPEKDGFSSNESFIWKYFDSSSDTEYDVFATYANGFPNTGLFQVNGISVLLALQCNSSQLVAINQGWNIISTYIDPVNPYVPSVFSGITSSIILMKNELGEMYWPAYNLNLIGNMTIGEAYQIKLTQPENLTIAGIAVLPQITPVILPLGWSFFGYLRNTPAPVTLMLEPVVNQIFLVKDGDGNPYWPVYNVNLIGNMLPGKGYQVKMITQASLVYPPNSAAFNKSGITPVIPEHFGKPLNTGNNMTLGFAILDLRLTNGEIGVFTGEGLLVGSSVLNDGFTAVTLWGDDELTQEKDGLSEGEAFNLVLWNSDNGEELPVIVTNWTEGNCFYKINGISIAGQVDFNNNESGHAKLYQNVPNPFKGTTSIRFFIPEKMYVTLTLYNVTGEKMKTLISGDLEPGFQSFDFSSKDYIAGVYYYRLHTQESTEVKKMTLLK